MLDFELHGRHAWQRAAQVGRPTWSRAELSSTRMFPSPQEGHGFTMHVPRRQLGPFILRVITRSETHWCR